MIRTCHFAIALSFIALACRELPQATSPSQPLAVAQSTSNARNPAWWNKYLFLAENGPMRGGAPTASTGFDNVDVSNECGPQSETYITLNPNGPRRLTAGSNEIFRLPMRAYFSSDGGSSWGGADVPLPPPLSGTNDTRFGSDPTLAFDTQGNVFYGFIVVFFSATFNTPSNGVGINGTELAVARSSDGGSTWPRLTQFSFEPGENHFNDKPMITVDGGDASRFSDNVYVAWDAAFGGSTGGGIRVARSTDHGASFAVNRAGTTGILLSFSDNAGLSWSAPASVGHQVAGTDRFNQWLSVDPVTGDVTASYYDTQNDATGQRFMTDVYLSRSTDGGATWLTDVRVTTQSSNEHDCNGLFPCPSINYGNQQGDYEGLVSFRGVSHPIWTDSRRNTERAGDQACGRGRGLMEEVFSATVRN